jgi:hypothetical protein
MDTPPDEIIPKRNSGKTGPTTLAGKQTSSRNAETHGLCSKKILIAGENPDDWHYLRNLWFNAYLDPALQPDDLEHQLIQDAAESDWRRRRAVRRFEELEEAFAAKDPLEWTEEEHKQYERFLRYKTTNERAHVRELQALEQKRRGRQRAARETAKNPPANPNPTPLRPALKDEKPTFQYVYITVVDGQTITDIYPPNEVMSRIAADKEPGTVIVRNIEFPPQPPPEYSWLEPLGFNSDKSIAYFRQKMDVPTWLKLIAREQASGTGLLQPVPEYRPPE